MDFLTKPLFDIGSFSVVVWHLIVAVVVVVLAVVIILLALKGGKKSKKQVESTQQKQVEQPVEQPKQQEQPAPQEETQQPEETQPSEQTTGESSEASEQGEQEPKKPTSRNYHISLREDGKWQVKLAKGGKAIKLFDTQAEAIEFAKARALANDGKITIHKVDGKIRKQKY